MFPLVFAVRQDSSSCSSRVSARFQMSAGRTKVTVCRNDNSDTPAVTFSCTLGEATTAHTQPQNKQNGGGGGDSSLDCSRLAAGAPPPPPKKMKQEERTRWRWLWPWCVFLDREERMGRPNSEEKSCSDKKSCSRRIFCPGGGGRVSNVRERSSLDPATTPRSKFGSSSFSSGHPPPARSSPLPSSLKPGRKQYQQVYVVVSSPVYDFPSVLFFQERLFPLFLVAESELATQIHTQEQAHVVDRNVINDLSPSRHLWWAPSLGHHILRERERERERLR